MAINISVKTRIRFNGQEYQSVDEMPAEVRQAYEKAMASLYQRNSLGSKSLVYFNGQEYSSIDAMPEDVRALYRQFMASVANRKWSAIVAALLLLFLLVMALILAKR